MPEMARLRVHGHGEIEVDIIISYLSDFKCAYDSLFVLEHTLENVDRFARRVPFEFYQLGLSADWPIGSRRYIRSLRDWPPSSEQLALLVPTSERLALAKVELSSPGFWEFLGSLNPLEVLRKYLNDRHERGKDKRYRESAEERRLRLENLMLENTVISERIKIAKEIGATDRDLAPLVNALARDPLLALDQYQNRGVIEHTELIEKPQPSQKSR